MDESIFDSWGPWKPGEHTEEFERTLSFAPRLWDGGASTAASSNDPEGLRRQLRAPYSAWVRTA
jgi:hypothetical protein